MASQAQFKTTSKMCRYGTRGDCPMDKCRFQHSTPAHILYSTALKGVAPPPPTPVPSPTRARLSSSEQGTRGWRSDGKVHEQHIRPSVENAVLVGPRDLNGSTTTPSGTFDTSALTQVTGGLALYRAWLESQVEAQKARIQAMSKQYSIPIPQLNLDSFDFPPLGTIPPAMANTLPTTTGSTTTVVSQHEAPSMPPASRLEPTHPFPRAPAHIPKSASAASQYHHEGPISATHTGAVATCTHGIPNSSTTAPRNVDMSYKTTPCRHFTLNRGWCPWGDECCFIHDPDLEWVPAPERGSSGRSTPSSTTLVGGNYKPVYNGTVAAVAEPGTALRSSSSQSAHCWGYIQGLCPHSGDNCKYTHPANIVPYIKYTPCLTWPRCGYPTQVCPLKHPQVDKFAMPHPRGQPTVARETAPVIPQPQAAIVRAPYASEQHRPLAFPIAPDASSLHGTAPLVGASSFVIPHDAAYASAVQYHNPMPPSAGTFSPAPRVAVRLSRPSDDTGHLGHVSTESVDPVNFGISGVRQVRGRRVSIAVQRPDAELAGGASGFPGHGKEYVKGHGRGKSMHL